MPAQWQHCAYVKAHGFKDFKKSLSLIHKMHLDRGHGERHRAILVTKYGNDTRYGAWHHDLEIGASDQLCLHLHDLEIVK
jgi:hypothetical protein